MYRLYYSYKDNDNYDRETFENFTELSMAFKFIKEHSYRYDSGWDDHKSCEQIYSGFSITNFIEEELYDTNIDAHFSPMFIGTINENEDVVRDYELYAIHISYNPHLNNVYKREILIEKVIKFD